MKKWAIITTLMIVALSGVSVAMAWIAIHHSPVMVEVVDEWK